MVADGGTKTDYDGRLHLESQIFEGAGTVAHENTHSYNI